MTFRFIREKFKTLALFLSMNSIEMFKILWVIDLYFPFLIKIARLMNYSVIITFSIQIIARFSFSFHSEFPLPNQFFTLFWRYGKITVKSKYSIFFLLVSSFFLPYQLCTCSKCFEEDHLGVVYPQKLLICTIWNLSTAKATSIYLRVCLGGI